MSPNLEAELDAGLGEPAAKRRVTVVAEEDTLAAIASLRDMM